MSGRQFKKLKRLLINCLLFPVFMGMAVEGEPPADPPADSPPADPPANDPPQGDPPQDPPEPSYEDLVKQSDEIRTKAEELRRSKLTDEERAAEDKVKADAETAAAANKAPEEYADFKMPKDMPVDAEILSDFKPLAKELDLSQDKAQKLIDLYAEKVAPAMAQRQLDAWTQTREGWVNTAKADKEIGGDKFEPALEDAMRVVNTLGTPELKETFNEFGLGDHPELLRVFSRMAKYLKEDTLPGGSAGSGSGKSTAHDMYPYMNP